MLEPVNKLGTFCRKRRLELELVLREAAERSGLSYSEISAIERGDRPSSTVSLSTSTRLASIFGIDPALFAAAAIIANQADQDPKDTRTFEDILAALTIRHRPAPVST